MLTESGTARYSPAGWADALLAGALVISDMPFDRVREFRRFSVEVTQEATAAVLQKTVEDWLGNAPVLAQKMWGHRHPAPQLEFRDGTERLGVLSARRARPGRVRMRCLAIGSMMWSRRTTRSWCSRTAKA